VAQLIEYEKQFLILGNMNAMSYKEIFPLFKENQMWYGKHSGAMEFNVSLDSTAKSSYIAENGLRYQKFGNISWFTNMDLKKRHETLILTQRYELDKYPYYDNYEAINVDKVVGIPVDYDGVMGVPLTFMSKYNPEQFEILGMAAGNTRANKFNYNVPHKRHENDRGGCGVVKGVRKYTRIFIRNRHPEKPEGEN